MTSLFTMKPAIMSFLALFLCLPFIHAAVEGEPGSRPTRYGSGFFVTDGGYLITNHHVIGNSRNVLVQKGKKKYSAKIVRIDKGNDLALLKVEGRFVSLPISPANSVRLAEDVFTVGYPQI